MNKYEIMYIIRPGIEEEAQKELIERFNTVLTDNGAEVLESKIWGKRRLAYEINDFREGVYNIVKVNSNPEAINEFDRLSKINDGILRHMIIKVEE